MARLHRGPLQVLVGDIVHGDLPPGIALPREADLAQRFHVSRGTAREFVRGLEERGLIAVTHGRGATVREAGEWDRLDPDVLAALLTGDDHDRILADLLEARRILEVDATALAASRAAPDDVARLTSAYSRTVDAAQHIDRPRGGAEADREADVAFHRALVELTGNPVLVALLTRINGAMLQAAANAERLPRRVDATLAEHERILRAVTDNDAEAARRAMAQHLDAVERVLLGARGEASGSSSQQPAA